LLNFWFIHLDEEIIERHLSCYEIFGFLHDYEPILHECEQFGVIEGILLRKLVFAYSVEKKGYFRGYVQGCETEVPNDIVHDEPFDEGLADVDVEGDEVDHPDEAEYANQYKVVEVKLSQLLPLLMFMFGSMLILVFFLHMSALYLRLIRHGQGDPEFHQLDLSFGNQQTKDDMQLLLREQEEGLCQEILA
jgi:hypothetical protein